MKKTINTIWTIVTLPIKAIILLAIAPFAIAAALADDMEREYAQAKDCGFTNDFNDFRARYDEWQNTKSRI